MILEYGKRYVLANGKVTGPMVTSGLTLYPYRAKVDEYDTQTWNVSGFHGLGDWRVVSEYVEPVAALTPAPEPKKLRWVPGRTYKMSNGGLVFVISFSEGQSFPVMGFRLYPGEDAEEFPNTWTIDGKRHMGNVNSSFDIVDYAYEVGEDDQS